MGTHLLTHTCTVTSACFLAYMKPQCINKLQYAGAIDSLHNKEPEHRDTKGLNKIGPDPSSNALERKCAHTYT